MGIFCGVSGKFVQILIDIVFWTNLGPKIFFFDFETVGKISQMFLEIITLTDFMISS